MHHFHPYFLPRWLHHCRLLLWHSILRRVVMNALRYRQQLSPAASPSTEKKITEAADCFRAVSRLGEHILYAPKVLLTMFRLHHLSFTPTGNINSSGRW